MEAGLMKYFSASIGVEAVDEIILVNRKLDGCNNLLLIGSGLMKYFLAEQNRLNYRCLNRNWIDETVIG